MSTNLLYVVDLLTTLEVTAGLTPLEIEYVHSINQMLEGTGTIMLTTEMVKKLEAIHRRIYGATEGENTDEHTR